MYYTREQIRSFIRCPQLGSEDYGEWGALRLEQRLAINSMLDQLDSADAYIRQLEEENEECKLDVQDYLKQAQENAEIYRKAQKKIQDLKANSISKSVIREKIEEIRKTHSPEDDYACSQIHILKKLLGEKDENRN